MESSQNQENSRIKEIFSKSGGQIQTSATALRDLEHRINENTKIEKSPRGKIRPFSLREWE